MNRKGMLLAVAILLCTTGFAWSQERELHGLIDLTFQSKYIWRGFDMYDDKGAIQPAVDLDLYNTGFGFSAMGHRDFSHDFEDGERWDYSLYYYNQLFNDKRYAINYRISWVYYNFPSMSSDWGDLQEINGIISCPNLLPVKCLVPTYVAVKMWPASGDNLVTNDLDLRTWTPSTGRADGWLHLLMLDYSVPIEFLVFNLPTQVFDLHAELVYNDGVGPSGQNVNSDWSHTVLGVSTDIDLGRGFMCTPAVYYQKNMERTVNPDKEEIWASLSVIYKF